MWRVIRTSLHSSSVAMTALTTSRSPTFCTPLIRSIVSSLASSSASCARSSRGPRVESMGHQSQLQLQRLPVRTCASASVRQCASAVLKFQRFLLLLLYSNELQLYLFYSPGLLYLQASLFQLPAGYGLGPLAQVAPAPVVVAMYSLKSSAGYGRGPRAPVSPARSGASTYFLKSMSILPPRRRHQGSSSVRRPATMRCLMSTFLLPPRRPHQGWSSVQRPSSSCSRHLYSYIYNKPLLQANLSMGRRTPEFH